MTAPNASTPSGITLLRRREAAASLLSLLTGSFTSLSGCGGGSGGSAPDPNAPPLGSRQAQTIRSRFTGTTYPLGIYLPPASAGPRGSLPAIYMLDGESWFETMSNLFDVARTPAMLVAIHGAGMRNRDYVPGSTCTAGGGGHAEYFDFLRQELQPMIEGSIGGDPLQRVLFGHSHGGSFVLYAMYAQGPGAHAFRSYLSVDASVGCLGNLVYDWDAAYAAAHAELPVRLHLSSASGGNASSVTAFSQIIERRRYARFALKSEAYAGTHNGIVPQAFSEGVAFALAGAA